MRVLLKGQLGRYAGSGISEGDRLEQELAAFVGTQHALVVNSGTSALVTALAALRLGPGDEVLIPAYTWVSTAAAVIAVGAVPVLVDVDDSLTLSPSEIGRRVTARTRAVIPVHMLNLPCDMEPILAAARNHDLLVVEDACQAVGVSYKGRRVGSFGNAGAFSFNQHKNMSSGEGGAVVTNDQTAGIRARMYHDVGHYIRPGRAEHDIPSFVGLNLRMPELSSAVLRPQLRRLPQQMKRRHERRLVVLDHLVPRSGITVSPHHSPDDAVGLTVIFDEAEDAVAYARQAGVTRLLDTGRHVYTNWQPVLARATFDPRVDPWHDSDVTYSAANCPATLDLLARTCTVSLQPGLPLPLLRRRARMYAAA